MGLRTLSCLLVLAFLLQFVSGQQRQQPLPDPPALKTLTQDIVPAALVRATCDSTDPCVIDCTGCTANDKVPDPENCRGYYMCEDQDNYYPLPLDCEDGQVFNATLHECVKGDSCEPCGQTFEQFCPYECNATNPVPIASFDDCAKYYTCNADGSVNTSMTCDSEAPFFDGAECQTDETRCCHCHAFCFTTSDALFIADPLDCRGYYLCTAADVGKTPTSHGMCDEGEYFDSVLGTCSDTASCKTECENVVGADGCIEPFTCLENGYFAKCPLAEKCTPEYYYCASATGTYQEAESCSSGVFHPDTHNCVSEDMCP